MAEEQMQIVVAELQPGEREYLETRLPPVGHWLDCSVDNCPIDAYQSAEILSVFVHSQVSRDVLHNMPHLRFIATRSTGYDQIDLLACTERDILVSNVPHYGENTVAEHTFGLILSLSRRIYKAYQRTIAGDFSLQGLEGTDVKGKTLGVIGAGTIGLHVIRIAAGFGMHVLAYDVKPNNLIAEVLGFEYVSLEEIYRNADIISLHAPSTPETYHIINEESLKQCKRGAILINTARGALVDTGALIAALDNGILAGAGLDVLEGEELIEEEERLLNTPEAGEKLRLLLRRNILLRRSDVLITPHMAFYSKEAIQRILDTTVDNIRAFLAGRPQHVVNGLP